MKTSTAIPIVLVIIAFVGILVWNTVTNSQAIPTISGNTQSTIKIGAILPLSGDAASGGIPLKQAAEIAIAEINEAGGIKNKQIEAYWQDGRCEKTSAQVGADQLLNSNKVNFLIAGACTDEFLVAAPLAQQKNIISFTSSATSPEISKLGKYVFRTVPSDALTGKVAAQYARNKLKAKTAVIIAEKKEFPLALKNVFQTEFEVKGGQVVKEFIYETGDTNFSGVARQIKTLNPGVIYIIPQTEISGVLAIKEIKEQKISSPLLSGEILLLRDTVASQGKVLEGMTGVEVFYDEKNSVALKFFKEYRKKFGTDPTYPAYMNGMYDIIYLIKDAYEHTNGTSDKVAAYLHGLKNWPGSVGELTFDQNGDPILNFAIRKVKDGKADLVEVYKPEE